jgi:hypothetical protein
MEHYFTDANAWKRAFNKKLNTACFKNSYYKSLSSFYYTIYDGRDSAVSIATGLITEGSQF